MSRFSYLVGRFWVSPEVSPFSYQMRFTRILWHILAKACLIALRHDNAGDVLQAEIQSFRYTPFPFHIEILAMIFRKASREGFDLLKNKLSISLSNAENRPRILCPAGVEGGDNFDRNLGAPSMPRT